jgi:Fur family iron response transcriptional regulator
MTVSMTQLRTMTFTAPVPSEKPQSLPMPASGLNGCPWHDVKALLRQVGLRPTRQRMALGWILFGKGDRHLTAEMLYEEASRAKVPVSLATVYNTMHQFTEAGLLREVTVDGTRTYFDTNIGNHHHFYCEDDGTLLDIDGDAIEVAGVPAAPQGAKVDRVDVIVRLKRR